MPFSPQDRSVWIAETAELSVRITAEALQDMEREVMHGFKALPKRGAETGGALYGHVTEEDGVRTVTVERVLPITCEYQSGPSFRLSASDHAKLAADLTAQPQRPVGFFRSHTRADLELTTDDRLLLERHFPVDGLVLLLRPLDLGDCEARIYALQNGKVDSAGHGPIPFGWKYRTSEPSAESSPVPPSRIPAPPPLPPSPIQTIQKKRPALHYVLLAVLIAGACLISYQAGRYTRFTSAARPDPHPFRLSVTRDGNKAQLSWDPQHPQVRDVPEALLTITDGEQSSARRLSRDELRAGAVSYEPHSGDVTFELQVPLQTGWLTQSTRLISALETPSMTGEPATIATAQSPPQAAAPATATPVAQQAPAPVPVAQQAPAPVPEAVIAKEPPKPPAVEMLKPPAQEATKATDERLNPREAETQVANALRSWSAALLEGDVDSHISHYGPTVKTYFDEKGVSKQEVAQQVRRAIAQNGEYRTHKIRIIAVRPVAPDRATAVIRKQWTTAGSSAGEIEEELELAKRSRRWEIVSERQTRLLWVRH